MENPQKPIKRSEQLKRLSREHHAGLLFSWKIKQGISIGVSVERMQHYVNYFVNGHLLGHFEQEEKLLFNQVDIPACLQARKQHIELKGLIQKINHTPDVNPDVFITFIKMLNDHIRFEERVVFPLLEELLDEQTLNTINDVLEMDDHAFKDEYPDEFWLKPKKSGGNYDFPKQS